jgi:hypothetical protein
VIDKQLEGQLERIRSLNEQLSAMHRGVAENNRLIERDLGTRKGPLNDVRDYRTLQSPDYDDFPPQQREEVRRRQLRADASGRRRRR